MAPSISSVREGLSNPQLAFQYLTNQIRYALIRRLTRNHEQELTTRVLDLDWDNLILLDACRYDIFKEVNRLEGRLQRRQSLGSATPEFIKRNFSDCRCYDTVMVSANAMVGTMSDCLDLYKLVGLWAQKGTVEPEENTNVNPRSLCDPSVLVNRALSLHHEYPHKRLIIHFLPPHTPYLVKDGEAIPDGSKYRTFEGVRNGTVTEREIREIYRENVSYVLEFVEDLSESLDGKTVVSADHGELLGEGIPIWCRLLHPRWSIFDLDNFDYGHYGRTYVPELLDVPWLELPHEGRRRIIRAEQPAGIEMDESAIDQQLEALGYKG